MLTGQERTGNAGASDWSQVPDEVWAAIQPPLRLLPAKELGLG
jgi:hypothetical protein